MQVELSDPDLGVLELGCDPYVVTQLQIGSPAVRDVSRNRALADGTFDDTRYVGARAVSMSVRLVDSGCNATDDMQQLIDRIVPYMSPRRRPTLTWQLPGSQEVRALTVRGDNWPFVLDGPRHQALGLQWVAPDGEIRAGTADGSSAERCTTIKPGAETELGRLYNETYVDGGRGPYPYQDPIGARSVINPGSSWAHWHLTIFGAVTNPVFTVNDIEVEFNRNGGLVLPTGQSVVMDTRDRTVLLNGTPTDSRYNRVNFDEWSWDELRLHPGENTIRYDGTALGPASSAILCYTPVYLG